MKQRDSYDTHESRRTKNVINPLELQKEERNGNEWTPTYAKKIHVRKSMTEKRDIEMHEIEEQNEDEYVER